MFSLEMNCTSSYENTYNKTVVYDTYQYLPSKANGLGTAELCATSVASGTLGLSLGLS